LWKITVDNGGPLQLRFESDVQFFRAPFGSSENQRLLRPFLQQQFDKVCAGSPADAELRYSSSADSQRIPGEYG